LLLYFFLDFGVLAKSKELKVWQIGYEKGYFD
jgi:hypothetical protein